MANSCMSLSDSICRGCRDNVGGLKAIYVADYYDIDWTTVEYWVEDDTDTPTGSPKVTVDEVVGAVKNIAFDSLYGKWYKLEPNKYSASWTENINVSVENGTLGYEQVVTGVFGKNRQTLRTAISEMSKGDMVMILVDGNDRMWLIGEPNNGAYVSGGNSASGTAIADLNGWNVNFTCNAKAPALEVVLPVPGSGETPNDLANGLEEADSSC